ncbi:hypothetical protein BOSEA31B_20124 [Hyphomicrobiales bacterium]|jgi:hypothetical protein|nr:hypothetical protein BOSEA31B_20124 [Hyphomicrobiales bacterium]CAH1702504.1 hypothetical protein BOSEA1005_30376 [Hyphomicrobiales bacterium]CAI0346705.1 hypothetical protein BO1005MUT1_520217 [Hyphomicrobiales bacterium]
MAGLSTQEIADEIAALSPSQKDALLNAKRGDGGWGWVVSTRHPGVRGLPTRGLAHGRATANRAAGALGSLTAKGETILDALRAATLEHEERGEEMRIPR